MSFWAERLREERYAITDEQLRPYFALPAVLDGLFAVRSSHIIMQALMLVCIVDTCCYCGYS